ncbi:MULTISPECIES: cytochrome c1 [Corallincola]|uniref:Cytochrome c1 n=3 Tax=Corallincola TaxID=1775176 RepID=A0A368NKD2_9GAMM|nr:MULTISPECIES: cytochrome c1 [Corallincola]RCU49869.1 cytochrome c1 [Corallincola holothuriorum]TAA45151.1 cytochrome c1 [Corallincola spongiicola]TCI03572.1 cytochrome c1 [Corallincola luteus]
MKRMIIALVALLPSLVMAAGGNVHLDKANYDLTDKASLQTGAKLFMNYCSGCHSTKYQRYERVARDLGISAALMQENLMFIEGTKIGALMENAMSDELGAKWFGATPPDLTLVARVRGADWLYTYLRSFYEDPTRPFGVNNVVFKDVGMPHVLQELQGVPRKTYESRLIDGEQQDVYVGIRADGSGEMSTDEYDHAVLDLVNFLVYSAEPVTLERRSMGWWVLGFLVIFTILAYLLKKEFFRDLH